MSILAVDMGGTNIKIGLVENGGVTKHQTLPAYSERGAQQALDRTAAVLKSMRDDHCTGVGFAFPTLVDVRTNRVVGQMIGKHEGLTTIDFPKWAREQFDLPIHIENDAHAAILGEWKHGAGRGCDDLVMMTLGTGIGGGIVRTARSISDSAAPAASSAI